MVVVHTELTKRAVQEKISQGSALDALEALVKQAAKLPSHGTANNSVGSEPWPQCYRTAVDSFPGLSLLNHFNGMHRSAQKGKMHVLTLVCGIFISVVSKVKIQSGSFINKHIFVVYFDSDAFHGKETHWKCFSHVSLWIYFNILFLFILVHAFAYYFSGEMKN